MSKERELSLIIVDDEKSIRDGLSNYIDWKSLGYHVIGCFEDGRDVEEFLTGHHADVILTDIKMAQMSGLELAEILLRNGFTTKIVIMSGYRDFEYARKAIKLNVCEYLLKPIEIDTIREVFGSLYREICTTSDKPDIEETNIIRGDQSEYSELVITKATNFMKENYHRDISLDDVADHVYLSPVYFCRFFKEITGINFLTYLTDIRMKKALIILKTREKKISEISGMVGYKNTKYFTRVFKKHFGLVPSDFLRREFKNES